MGIQFDGIVSGLDTTAMIEAILDVEAVAQQTLEDQLAEYEERLEATAGLSNRLSDVSDYIDTMDTPDEFSSISANITGTAIDVTTDAGALSGTYNISVSALAQAEVEASDGFADKDALGGFAEGTLSVTIGGDTTDITIDSSNSSLTDVAEAIDAIEGLNAYVLDDGSGANPYRLVVQAEETGSSNTITLDTSGLTGPGQVPVFTEEIAASDAQLNINGVDITSESNTISEAIPGVTLDLNQTTTGTEVLTVDTDIDGIIENIQGFVDAYNEVMSYYDTQTAYDLEEDIRGGLVGETTASRVIEGVSSIISDQYESLTGVYSSLAEIGFETQTDGTLTFDTEQLREALEENYEDTMELFTDPAGPAGQLRDSIQNLYIDSESGSLALRQETLEETISDYEEQIADFDDYLASYEERLRNQFTYMEQTLGALQAAESALLAMLGNAS